MVYFTLLLWSPSPHCSRGIKCANDLRLLLKELEKRDNVPSDEEKEAKKEKEREGEEEEVEAEELEDEEQEEVLRLSEK